MAKSKAKAKKKVVKKKVAKKKTTKPVANPHAGKRYFMLEFGGYGGEFIFGRTTEEFVKYWLHKDRTSSLSDHVMAMHDGAFANSDDMLDEEDNDEVTLDVPEGFDEDSPSIADGVKYIEYYDLGDIEHQTVVSAEYSAFTVTEIELHNKARYQNGGVTWDDKECKKRGFDWSQKQYTEKGEGQDYQSETVARLYSVENFVHDTKKGLVDPVPVIQIYDAQKGTFFRVIVETQGQEFDVKKLVFGVNENSQTTYIDQIFYDRLGLERDHDWLSTWGKGFHVDVGYTPAADLKTDYKELLEQGWQDLEDAE